MGRPRELGKQIAVGFAIMALLPLVVWYATSAFSTPPDWKQYAKTTARLDERTRDAKEESEKEKHRAEKDRLEKELEQEERVFFGNMFWVAYPVGLAAIILGTFFRVQAVGAGLMFSGLGCLGTGCYSYWDRMGDWLRLGSLALALLTVIVLGTWRFRPDGDEGNSPGD